MRRAVLDDVHDEALLLGDVLEATREGWHAGALNPVRSEGFDVCAARGAKVAQCPQQGACARRQRCALSL